MSKFLSAQLSVMDISLGKWGILLEKGKLFFSKLPLTQQTLKDCSLRPLREDLLGHGRIKMPL